MQNRTEPKLITKLPGADPKSTKQIQNAAHAHAANSRFCLFYGLECHAEPEKSM